MLNRFQLLNLFLLLAMAGAAQVPGLVAHIGDAQGFSNATVYCFLKDQKGLMWYGTSDGLWRYDGYEHIVYRHDPKNEKSLGHSFVVSLTEDNAGYLWVGTLEGLNRFDPATQTTTRFTSTDTDFTALSLGDIYDVIKDAQGRIWVAADKLNLLNSDGKTFTRFDDRTIDQWGALSLMADDKEKVIWVGSSGDGFFRFDPPTKKFRNYQVSHPDATIQQRANVVRSIKKDRNGLLWMATYGGLLRFDPATEKITHWYHQPDKLNSLPHNSLWDIAPDNNGRVWIASWGGGISYLDVESGNFEINQFLAGGLFAISGKEFPSLYLDKDGLLWCGSNGKGIFQIPQIAGLAPLAGLETIPRPIDRVIGGKNHTYFLPSSGGVFAYHRLRGIDYYLPPASARQKNSLSGNRVASISETTHGVVAIGTDYGLTIYSPASKKLQHFVNKPGDTTSLSHNSVITTYIDQHDHLWLGTPHGLCLFNPATGNFSRWRSPFLSGDNVLSIARNAQGLWIGTSTGGLNLIDFKSKSALVFQHDPKNDSTLQNNFVRTLLVDSNGRLWVGTQSGISKLNTDGKTFVNIPTDRVVTQISQNRGVLIVQTSEGMGNISLADEKLQMADMPILPGGLPRLWSAAEKTYYYVAERELAALPFANYQRDTIPPSVVITKFYLNTNATHPLDSTELAINDVHRKSISLNHHQNIFFVEFAALNYKFPNKSQYTYKLDGFDADWTYCGSRRFASYTNLDPGTYTFRVKAANYDGAWNEQGTSLQINVLPPPWRTWWAYTGYSLLFIAGLYAARKTVVNRERLKAQVLVKQKENQTLQELNRLKTNFFSNITHEFRTPLTLIQGPAEQLLETAKDDDEKRMLGIIKSNTLRLLKLINQLLDLARVDAKETVLNNKPTALHPLLRINLSQFESLALDRGINYRWQLPESLPTVLADGEKLETIVINLTSNALKFTPAGGRVLASVKTESPWLMLTVEDTGRGIPKEKLAHVFERFYQVETADSQYSEGTGIGLALVKEYVELMKGRIDVQSIVGQGTRFEVMLPITITSEEVAATPPEAGKLWEAELSANGSPDLPLLLVADDNEDIRVFIKTCLGKTYRYVEARNGDEALQQARELLPDLIISDVMMPVMDGIALCHEIKTDTRTDHIPFIMLTAKSADESKLAGLRTGADEYLTKPFQKTELALRVQNLLHLQQKLREHIQREIVTASQSSKPQSANELFVLRAKAFVEEHLKDEQLSVETLANHLNLSREQCYRKILSLTGLSPSSLIKKIRLARAQNLIHSRWGNVSQVAYEVGFENLSHFSKAYKDEFGRLPSEA